MNPNNDDHQDSQQGSSLYRIDWDSRGIAPQEKARAHFPDPKDALATLCKLARESLSDFETLDPFLAYLESEFPNPLSWDNPATLTFLELVDQMEDLAWAVELKRQSEGSSPW